MLYKAYSLINTKGFDPEKRSFSGIATHPQPDRVGDVIDPKGLTFKNPLPLLLYHKNTMPVGEAVFGRPSDDGTPFNARISKIDRETGVVRERLDEAVDSLQADPPLIRGVSIGFRALEDPIFIKETGGFRFPKTEVVELSMVVIPANAEATIALVKSLDVEQRAALSDGSRPVHQSGVSDVSRVVKAIPPKPRDAMTNIREQITSFEATRQAKSAQMTALMQKAADAGTTLDEADQQSYDGLETEVEQIDKHLVRLAKLEKVNAAKAVPVVAPDPQAAAQARSGNPVISVNPVALPPGIGFARMAMAKAVSHLDHRYIMDVAKEMWPSDQRLHKYIETKAAVPAANTQNALWAGNLTYADNLASEFVEYLRPMTILGQFGTNGRPSLRRVPFNIRFNTQTTGGEAWWVGEGAPKPVTSLEFTADTLTWAKVASIAVITQEQARFSTPAIEGLVRDALAGALRDKLDRDFVDPGTSAVANVSPASITNGLTPQTSAGTSADNVRTDIQNLLEQFILDNMGVRGLVLIMPETLALVLSLMVNSLGQPEFPGISVNGGNLLGIPVITSQYAGSLSGNGNMVIAVSANDVLLADDGGVDVAMSTEASLQMESAPTNNSRTATATTVVSMFQTDSIALKVERFITWKKRRSGAVVFMDEVNWGAIGSPS